LAQGLNCHFQGPTHRQGVELDCLSVTDTKLVFSFVTDAMENKLEYLLLASLVKFGPMFVYVLPLECEALRLSTQVGAMTLSITTFSIMTSQWVCLRRSA